MKMVAALPPHVRTQLIVDHILQKPVVTTIPDPIFASLETDIEKCLLTVETTKEPIEKPVEEVHE
jgi:hypothetical protein